VRTESEMNKVKQPQNKRNNNKYKYITIQSRMNKRVQRLHQGGWLHRNGQQTSQKKTPKEINKNLKPNGSYQLPGSHANAAKHLCHRERLSLTLALRKSRTYKPESLNHRRNVSNFKKILSMDLDLALRFDFSFLD
jgi:hypothetical protein